ncbi:IS3 family transposase [Thermaerobacillus caldiproteolyticus]
MHRVLLFASQNKNVALSQNKTEQELYQAIDNYIWFYNHERFQPLYSN